MACHRDYALNNNSLNVGTENMSHSSACHPHRFKAAPRGLRAVLRVSAAPARGTSSLSSEEDQVPGPASRSYLQLFTKWIIFTLGS